MSLNPHQLMMAKVLLKRFQVARPAVQVGAQVVRQKTQITTATASLVIRAMASTKQRFCLTLNQLSVASASKARVKI
jgi:hypothetical protein